MQCFTFEIMVFQQMLEHFGDVWKPYTVCEEKSQNTQKNKTQKSKVAFSKLPSCMT